MECVCARPLLCPISGSLEASMANVCKHWVRGSCRFGTSCRFLHPCAAGFDNRHEGASVELKDGPLRTPHFWSHKEARYFVDIYLYDRYFDFCLVFS